LVFFVIIFLAKMFSLLRILFQEYWDGSLLSFKGLELLGAIKIIKSKLTF